MKEVEKDENQKEKGNLSGEEERWRNTFMRE